jgi:insertion element IS1 protein InsB
VEVVISRVDEAEVDEMWSLVGKQQDQRWLWHVIDHWSGRVLAYVFGRRTDDVFLRLKARLEPLGISRYHTDDGGADTRHLAAEEHTPGKRHTPPIERKPLTVRTRIKRLVRRTVGCSRSIEMPDMVIGFYVNRDEFGLSV